MRLGRNFRKFSVPIGKKRPHLRKGKATEYLAFCGYQTQANECSPSEKPTPIPLILVLKNNPFSCKTRTFSLYEDPYFSTTLTYILTINYLFIDSKGKECMKQEQMGVLGAYLLITFSFFLSTSIGGGLL